MSNVRIGAMALALALAVVGTAAPAMAKSPSHHPGHAARAQALDPGEAVMTPEREKALRECSGMGAKLDQKTWGVTQGQMMRSCMNDHGQME
jgi:hypothetical protein